MSSFLFDMLKHAPYIKNKEWRSHEYFMFSDFEEKLNLPTWLNVILFIWQIPAKVVQTQMK